MKKNKGLLLSTMGVLLLSSTISGTASATSLKDMQNEQKQLQQKQNDLNKGIKQKSNEISENKTKKQSIIEQISSLNKEINVNNEKIHEVEGKIKETTKEIADLRVSIKKLEKRIKERDEVLRERVKTMQVKGGDVSYLDVLLGANSFSDFIDRFSAVSTLMDADRKIMKQQEDDIAQLEEEKALVEKKLSEQQDRKTSLTAMKKKLEGQKASKDKLVDQLEAEESKLASQKAHLESEAEEAHDLSADIENKIVAEQNRLAEVARQAELKRLAEMKKQQTTHASNSTSSSQPSISAPVVSSGAWTSPARGRMTSSFGWRVHPIFNTKKQHRGQDIALPIGSPVNAAAEGVVSHAGPMGGFGNVIMITHSMNGKIFTSVYAHLSSIGVGSGQHVGKGQYIAKSGNTGNSTGPHLHFEIHVGNFSASGPSAVNPLRYVSF